MQHLQLQCRSCHIYQSVSGICLPSGGQKKYPSGKSVALTPSSIGYLPGVKRNGYGGNGYVAILASAKAKQRKRRAGLRQAQIPLALQPCVGTVKVGLAPETIAGRLKRDRGEPVITHETIYRFIYNPKYKHLKLWQYLPRSHRKRRQWHGRKSRKELIPNRVSIHQRPEVINRRKTFGHWEGDSVIGKGHREAIHTEVERLARYFQAKLLLQFNSAVTVKAQEEIFDGLCLKPSSRLPWITAWSLPNTSS